jgi:hypothetical protein
LHSLMMILRIERIPVPPSAVHKRTPRTPRAVAKHPGAHRPRSLSGAGPVTTENDVHAGNLGCMANGARRFWELQSKLNREF